MNNMLIEPTTPQNFVDKLKRFIDKRRKAGLVLPVKQMPRDLSKFERRRRA